MDRKKEGRVDSEREGGVDSEREGWIGGGVEREGKRD